MGQIARRRGLWLHGGAGAVVLAGTLWFANLAMEEAPFLVMGIALEGILLVSAARILRGQSGRPWAEHLHTSGRWTLLALVRFVAVASAIAFLVVAIVMTLFGETPPTSYLALLGVTTLACVAGAVAEREIPRTTAASGAPPPTSEPAAVVYKTRTGVVKVMKAGKKREYVLTGDSDVRGLTDIERAIDARGWTQTDVPTDERLRAALERWGRFETR